MAGRLGGEEFGFLLPGTTTEGAVAMAERLRTAVAARTVPTPSGEALAVTFSAGAIEWRPEFDEQELLRRVDQALSGAKSEGRDRIVRDGAADQGPTADADAESAAGTPPSRCI